MSMREPIFFLVQNLVIEVRTGDVKSFVTVLPNGL